MQTKKMYSFKVETELIEKVKAVARKNQMPTSAYIRIAIIEKLNSKSRMDALEARVKRLEDKL